MIVVRSNRLHYVRFWLGLNKRNAMINFGEPDQLKQWIFPFCDHWKNWTLIWDIQNKNTLRYIQWLKDQKHHSLSESNKTSLQCFTNAFIIIRNFHQKFLQWKTMDYWNIHYWGEYKLVYKTGSSASPSSNTCPFLLLPKHLFLT